MPLIAYLCECKNSQIKYHRQVKDVPAFIICDKCGMNAKKCLSSPSSSSKITIDNGLMTKSIEVDPDIIAINKARSEKDYREE